MCFCKFFRIYECILDVVQVASWGAYLIKRNIITMSFAPRDSHEAQVQFALERGVPAMIGVISTERIPYPARSFDMAHCSRCLIPWNKFGELIYLNLCVFSLSYYYINNSCSNNYIIGLIS
uniref:Methyltransferase n=1 Tax=Oryza sativa TaxID=4530 RepID=Q9SPP2_ORYSA|nr:hypothetical protein [Oryza sativa Indica Group]